jgi:hypothetical protein
MIQGENRSYIATFDETFDMSKINKAILCVKPYGTSGTIEYEDLTIDIVNHQIRRKFTQEEALSLGTGTVLMELIVLYDGDRFTVAKDKVSIASTLLKEVFE